MQQRPPGLAQAVLKSNSRPKRINRALEGMLAEPDFKFPDEFKVSLKRGGVPIEVQERWAQSVEQAEPNVRKRSTFTLTATMPEETNQSVANTLGDLLNYVYSFTKILGRQAIPLVEVFFRNEQGQMVAKIDVDR